MHYGLPNAMMAQSSRLPWRLLSSTASTYLFFMHRSGVIKIGLLVLPNLHCVGDSSSRDSGTAARTSPQPNPAASQVEARCYRSSESVLLGPPTRRGQTGHAPGWIRLEGYGGRDSGDAELVDAAGFGLGAGWHRSGSDSVRVVGADDFLRTELRLLIFGDSAVGQGSAHS